MSLCVLHVYTSFSLLMCTGVYLYCVPTPLLQTVYLSAVCMSDLLVFGFLTLEQLQ